VTINREKRYQSIIGFGGAFTDSATLNIRSLPQNLSERLIKDYFAEDGIQYSIGRIPI
ncbi:glucosylceramidase-like protein, partial [Leptotrombidium deliense]